MSDEINRWDRVQEPSRRGEQFHARSNTASRHADAEVRRNLDKEEAARDRLIFRWVMFTLAFIAVLVTLFFVVTHLGGK